MKDKKFIWLGPNGVNSEIGLVPKDKPFALTAAQEEKFLRLKLVKEFKQTTIKDKE